VTNYLDITVRLPITEQPPNLDIELLRKMLFGYVQGVLVPVNNLITADSMEWPPFVMHWHSSTNRDACDGCIEIAQDGVN
jgi:hypothetical protein